MLDQEVSKPDYDKLEEGAKAGHDAAKSEGDAPEEKKEAAPSTQAYDGLKILNYGFDLNSWGEIFGLNDYQCVSFILTELMVVMFEFAQYLVLAKHCFLSYRRAKYYIFT